MLSDGEMVTLSIQGVDDFVQAHEIADEWQILAMAGLIRVSPDILSLGPRAPTDARGPQ
jgi:hypothetical protein